MDQFACIFLEMDTLDSYGVRLAVIPYDFQVSVFTKGPLVLGYLVSFGQIGIKIIFARKTGVPVNGAIQCQTCTDAMLDGLVV
jgi:hypothetical protein